jgi:nucleoside-diphosphate-sugar epimerase
MRALYVEGLAKMLDVLPPTAKLVYVSSTGVYGQSAGETIDEAVAPTPIDSSGQVVLEAEMVLRQRRPDAVVLRFAGIYGPGRLPRSDALRRGEPIVGGPDRWLNLIHVEDGAAACVLAAERGRAGEVYNVSDDCPVSRRQFYTLLAELLGAPPPDFVPVSPGTAAREERGNRRISNRRLREELGLRLRYPTCAEGLRAT